MSSLGSWEAGAAVMFVLIGVALVSFIITVWYRRRLEQASTTSHSAPSQSAAEESSERSYALSSPAPSRRAHGKAREVDSAGEEGLSLLAHATYTRTRTPYDPLPPLPATPLVPNRLSIAHEHEDLEAQTQLSRLPRQTSRFQSLLPKSEASGTHDHHEVGESSHTQPSARRPSMIDRLQNMRSAMLHLQMSRPSHVPAGPSAPHTVIRKDTVASPTAKTTESGSSFSATHQVVHFARDTQDELSFPTFPSPASESPDSNLLSKASHDMHMRSFSTASAAYASITIPHQPNSPPPDSPVPHLRSVSVFRPSAQTRIEAQSVSCATDSPTSSVTVEHHRVFPSYPSVDLTSYNNSTTVHAVRAEA